MAWIQSHKSLERHPKVFKLSRSMGWDLDQTLGKLHRFWWWCVDYAEDGQLARFTKEDLAISVGIPKENADLFVNSMLESGFLDREPRLQVHDWWHHAGRYLTSKYHTGDTARLNLIRGLWVSEDRQSSGSEIGEPKDTHKGLPKGAPLRQSLGNPYKIRGDKIREDKIRVSNTLSMCGRRSRPPTHPSLEQVRAYCLERGGRIDPEKWMDYYQSNGWKVGKNPMKDWRAAVRTWEKNLDQGGQNATTRTPNPGEARPKPGKYAGRTDLEINTG